MMHDDDGICPAHGVTPRCQPCHYGEAGSVAYHLRVRIAQRWRCAGSKNSGTEYLLLGSARRLSESQAVLAKPGRCSATSGEYALLEMSKAISRAMMPIRGPCGCIFLIMDNVAMLSDRTSSVTRASFQCEHHSRNATRAARASTTCWSSHDGVADKESTALSAELKVSAIQATMLPPISKIAPSPHGLASVVMRTFWPRRRYEARVSLRWSVPVRPRIYVETRATRAFSLCANPDALPRKNYPRVIWFPDA